MIISKTKKGNHHNYFYSLSSKISVSSINSSTVGRDHKANISVVENKLPKEPELKVNEPNMVISPHTYLNPQNKEFNDIASNIMQEHIYSDVFTQNKRVDKNAKYIPTFDPIAMENELIDVQPRYLQPTTSRLLKELPPDDEEILLFKQRESEFLRSKTSTSKWRTNLNLKSDIVEFVVNSRTQRLEKYLESNHIKDWIYPSSIENNEDRQDKFKIFKNNVVKFNQKHFHSSQKKLKKSSTTNALIKFKERNQGIDATKINKMLETVRKKQDMQVLNNKFSEKVSKPVEDPFECIG